jgi:hypothetical protein
MGVILELKLNQKGWIYYLPCTNVANKNCVKFCMKEVFKCRERRMLRWDEEWTKAQAWGISPQEISKRYKRQSLRMPRGTPSSSTKIRSSFKTLYFYCFVYYSFFLERLYFCFQFSFVLFAVINGLTPTCFFWRGYTPFFIAKNTLVFTLFVQRVFSFLVLCLAFVFRLDFCSELVGSL